MCSCCSPPRLFPDTHLPPDKGKAAGRRIRNERRCQSRNKTKTPEKRKENDRRPLTEADSRARGAGDGRRRLFGSARPFVPTSRDDNANSGGNRQRLKRGGAPPPFSLYRFTAPLQAMRDCGGKRKNPPSLAADWPKHLDRTHLCVPGAVQSGM
ncbi:hypothetical protein EYF80_058267 [Liparis tanakae]|uniref:Uncharacterized protein n=1 Tax=Liparis tanakae TaxID=230148 RepID=A0A4Z2ESH1_9TELE|nr:hypothetical protein EYF80_058267 [Liparis tanakae]